MNLGQNKFYVGFGAVMVVATGVLGWFLFQSASDYSDARTRYEEQVVQLNALQQLPLYPEESNLKILEDQKEAAQEAVISLHQALLPRAFALEPMTPEQFQDKLNEAVKSIEEKAAKAGVQFSDKYYLGFSQYRAAVPKPEAAAVLGRQLKCVELAVNTLIDQKVDSVGEIVRDPLPEEGVVGKNQPPPPPPPVKAKGKNAKEEPPLVSKNPFRISFVTGQQPLRTALNLLSKNEKQFFILHPVSIKNEVENPPKKVDPEVEKAEAERAASLASPEGAAPGATPKPESKKYVLGAERINVTLRLDSVFFASNLPK